MSFRPAPNRLVAVLGTLVVAIAACTTGGTATTSPAGVTTPAPATPPPVVLPSGVVLPSFNADVDLEAQIPSTFCGQATQKFSFAGSEFVEQDEEFAAVVAALGRSAQDVSVAGAGVTEGECAGINLIAFRIKGADSGRFEQLFIDAQEKDTGVRPTRSNVGGKDVWVFTDGSDTTNYIYFKGDTIFGVSADSPEDAAKGLAVMP